MLKFYAKVMNDSKVSVLEVQHDLGIKIVHNDREYTLSEDNFGRLVLSSVYLTQITVLPRASNSVIIKSEE
jgi:hypothetical protein